MLILQTLMAFIPFVNHVSDVADWLPLSNSAIEKTVDDSVVQFEEELEQFLQVPEAERTFDNTIRTLDRLGGGLQQVAYCMEAIGQIHPEKTVREHADRAAQKLHQLFMNTQTSHPEIYQACLAIKNASPCLSDEERYYLDQLLLGFQRSGMQLPDEERALFRKIQEEILTLEAAFQRNISENSPVLYVSKEALAGLTDEWIGARQKNAEGLYELTCDLVTYNHVMQNCSVRETRKALYELFGKRAFPENEEVLVQLIAKRDQLAQILGYSSFADYSLSSQMAGSTERVHAFLNPIQEKARAKADLEFKELTQTLPPGVPLSSSNQLEGYDLSYVLTQYEKEFFSLDSNLISEYFPLEKTIQGLIQIYEQFFDLSIREVSHSIPIPDLRALELRDKRGNLLGIVLLDLFNREGKCPHSGIHWCLFPSYSPPGGPDQVALSLILTNSTKPTPDRPSLLTHQNARIFFHEFGHAIHSILGRSQFWCFCGTRVKTDFVELPSQLLERWLWDPMILKLISSHYRTGEPLSDELIEKMDRASSFGVGLHTTNACFLAKLALAFFEAGEKKDPAEVLRETWMRELPHISFAKNDHFYASWWHISGYGPRFYSYLWTKVFAMDVFQEIEKMGLLNPAAGARYTQTILSKGGGKDPNQLLIDFLGREPSQEPYLRRFD